MRFAVLLLVVDKPSGSIHTTIMEPGPKRPSPFPLWFLGPNSITVVYMDPLGKRLLKGLTRRIAALSLAGF